MKAFNKIYLEGNYKRYDIIKNVYSNFGNYTEAFTFDAVVCDKPALSSKVRI